MVSLGHSELIPPQAWYWFKLLFTWYSGESSDGYQVKTARLYRKIVKPENMQKNHSSNAIHGILWEQLGARLQSCGHVIEIKMHFDGHWLYKLFAFCSKHGLETIPDHQNMFECKIALSKNYQKCTFHKFSNFGLSGISV